jgi:hypothetical protein
MKKLFFFTIMVLFSWQVIICQTTITLQPDATKGKDAMVHSHSGSINTNFGNQTQFPASAWSAGENFIARSLVEFDFSSIPDGSTIVSANLSIFSIDSETAAVGMGQHEGVANACYLQRITSSWDENLVTWNNQPTTTDVNQVSLSATTSATQNFENIDVSALVQDMINNRSSSFGFLLRLQSEIKYNRVNFASSDHADVARRPKLVITYNNAVNSLISQPGAEGKDAILHSHPDYINTNMGSGIQFCSSAFTASSVHFTTRALIDFNLSSIPDFSSIDSAFLWLYAIDFSAGGMGYHFGTAQGGSENSCYLQRVTSDWDENMVTWNNQPTTTDVNQIMIPATITETQNLEKLNIKTLVQDMIDNRSNSFGFMMKLKTEETYRRVNYCTSDHSNPTLHPKIAVYFSKLNKVENFDNSLTSQIFPNPSSGKFNIQLKNSGTSEISIYTISGQKIKTIHSKESIVEVDLAGFSKGLYLVKIKLNNSVALQKIQIK